VDVEAKLMKIMKKIIIHSIPVFISMIWLATEHKTYQPLFLKGPDFLRFYLILVIGIYFSVFILKYLNETISKTTFYFLISIGILGLIKIIRGLYLGKPVGYLIMILMIKIIVILILKPFQFNKKFK